MDPQGALILATCTPRTPSWFRPETLVGPSVDILQDTQKPFAIGPRVPNPGVSSGYLQIEGEEQDFNPNFRLQDRVQDRVRVAKPRLNARHVAAALFE